MLRTYGYSNPQGHRLLAVMDADDTIVEFGQCGHFCVRLISHRDRFLCCRCSGYREMCGVCIEGGKEP